MPVSGMTYGDAESVATSATGDSPEVRSTKILLSAPDVGDEERQALLAAFDSGWIAPVGPDLDLFESELANYLGVEAVVAVSSGTAALHLALLEVGVKPGDRVIVPSTTFAASAFAVSYCGAEPLFCDVRSDCWTIDIDIVAEMLRQAFDAGDPIRAVMPVDLYGVCAEYGELVQVCDQFGAAVVADAAESLGSSTERGMAGSFGSIAAVSFNGNKIVSTSGGGAVAGSLEQVDRCRFLASQARAPVAHYEHTAIGYNYRLSNLLAGLGRAQLANLDRRIERRREIGLRYRSNLENLDFQWQETSRSVTFNNWLQVVQLPAGVAPEIVCSELAGAGIEARRSWKPMHRQPVYKDSTMIGGDVSDRLFERGLCLPSGSTLSDIEVDEVCDRLMQAVATAQQSGKP